MFLPDEDWEANWKMKMLGGNTIVRELCCFLRFCLLPLRYIYIYSAECLCNFFFKWLQNLEELLLLLMHAWVHAKSLQSCPTLCNPMMCSPPGSSVCGVFQARILEWVAISFPKGSIPTQGSNPSLQHWQVDSLPLSHQESPVSWLPPCFCPSIRKIEIVLLPHSVTLWSR